MTKKFHYVLIASALALSACSGFVPADQAPRPYVAAHDIIDGQCRDATLAVRNTNMQANVVVCPQEAGGVEDPGGLQKTDLR